jgi:hypothetical protein
VDAARSVPSREVRFGETDHPSSLIRVLQRLGISRPKVGRCIRKPVSERKRCSEKRLDDAAATARLMPASGSNSGLKMKPVSGRKGRRSALPGLRLRRRPADDRRGTSPSSSGCLGLTMQTFHRWPDASFHRFSTKPVGAVFLLQKVVNLIQNAMRGILPFARNLAAAAAFCDWVAFESCYNCEM